MVLSMNGAMITLGLVCIVLSVIFNILYFMCVHRKQTLKHSIKCNQPRLAYSGCGEWIDVNEAGAVLREREIGYLRDVRQWIYIFKFVRNAMLVMSIVCILLMGII